MILSAFDYVGSKAKISKDIIFHFPKDYKKLHYVEPFGGSAVILLNKTPSPLESFNDINDNVFIFFKVVKTRCLDLIKRADSSIHSESEYKRCIENLKKKSLDDVSRAYSFLYTQCFGLSGRNTFGFHKNPNRVRGQYFERVKRLYLISYRFRNVRLFCCSADKLIKRLDSNGAFFYLDPPYPDSDQSIYSHKFGRTEFNNLINILSGIKGKFLLSAYKKAWMEFPKSWNQVFLNKVYDHPGGKKEQRTELLIKNY